MPRKLPPDVQEQIRRRAEYLCEYCHTNERWQYVRFTIDHLLPTVEGGTDALDNLALACFHCNRRKSNKLTIFDAPTQQETPLFNPRLDDWTKHCIWSSDGLMILPLTAVGRVTIDLLDLNRERILHIRAADVAINRHPPPRDPVQST